VLPRSGTLARPVLSRCAREMRLGLSAERRAGGLRRTPTSPPPRHLARTAGTDRRSTTATRPLAPLSLLVVANDLA